MKTFKFPFLIYLNSNGTLGFSQNVYDYQDMKPNKIDVWVVNHRSQYEEIVTLHRLYLANNVINKIKHAKIHQLHRGTQIVYLPQHLIDKADLNNKEIQFGFVTSVKKDIVYCRYFSQYDLTTLRTVSCSERSPIENLYLLNTVERCIVRRWVRYINNQEKQFMDEIRKENQSWIRLER